MTAAFGAYIEVVILPAKTAVVGSFDQRDYHIQHIEEHGRMEWQRETGYNQRSRVEAQIGRWKQVIGNKLHGRNLATQTTEISIATNALNRMTALGRARFVRVT